MTTDTPPDSDSVIDLTKGTLRVRGGRAPLYHQIRELFRDKIVSGEWKPGQLIPPERELCALFNVSHTTTNLALRDLERLGLVERRQGSGTYVARPKLVQDLLGFYTLRKESLAEDQTGTIQVLSIEVVAPTARQIGLLKLQLGAEVIRLERLRLVNNEPIMIDVCILPHALYPDLEHEDLETNQLLDLVAEKYGIRIVGQEKTVEPVALDDYEAGLLRTNRGALGLQVERLSYAENRLPVEFRRWLVPGNRCKYVVQVAYP